MDGEILGQTDISEEPSEYEIKLAVNQVLSKMKLVELSSDGITYVPTRKYLRMSDKKIRKLRDKIEFSVRREIIRNRVVAGLNDLVESGQVEIVMVNGEKYYKVTEKGYKSFAENPKIDLENI